jgi:hypothetical protein
MENLVVSCAKCNSIASNKVFDNFEEKKKYILARRLEKVIRLMNGLLEHMVLNNNLMIIKL